MPTTIKFGKKFIRSPYKAIRKHMRIASECAACLPDALQSCFRNDSKALQEISQTLSELAADADKLLEELRQHLPDTRGIPFPRRDLFDVLEVQDASVNRTQKITILLLDLPMDVPRELHKPLIRMAERCVAAIEVAYEIVKSIEKVVEASFKGAQVDAVRKLARDVVAIGSEADALGSDISRALFAQCREMDPLAVVFLFQLVGWMEDLASCAEKLAIRSQLLLACQTD